VAAFPRSSENNKLIKYIHENVPGYMGCPMGLYLENNSGPRRQSNVRGTTTEQQQIVEGEEYFIFSENTR